jgi:hypothetical protein
LLVTTPLHRQSLVVAFAATAAMLLAAGCGEDRSAFETCTYLKKEAAGTPLDGGEWCDQIREQHSWEVGR